MGNLLYQIAAILVVAWLIGVDTLHLSGYVHLMLGVAALAILVRLMQHTKAH